MSQKQFITSGDMQYNPETGRWQPIAGNPMPPFVPSGGDPAGGPGAASVLTHDAAALHRAELERLGLPLPPALKGGQHLLETSDEPGEAPPVVSLGGTRHIVEGVPPAPTADGAELEPEQLADPSSDDRITELERKTDTERPGPPVRRRR
jgi:hypothetical protein